MQTHSRGTKENIKKNARSSRSLEALVAGEADEMFVVTVHLSSELREKLMLAVRQGKPFRCRDGVLIHYEDNPGVIHKLNGKITTWQIEVVIKAVEVMHFNFEWEWELQRNKSLFALLFLC
uniref:Uncharacterized protein n=1 Tax=Glossina austeni TaxID=7395 RepID=A0A1A9V6T4_GLOAU